MKTQDILVSVVIPAYNAEDTILNCLASVLEKRDYKAEVIVADDGSDDQTAALAGTFSPAISVIRCPHRGVSAARNAGLAAARGKWIFFADADDQADMKAITGMAAEAPDGDDLIMFPYAESTACGETEIIPVPLPAGAYTDRNVFTGLADRLIDPPFAARSETRFMKGRVYQYLFSARFLRENGLLFKEGLHFSEDCLFIYRCFLSAKSMTVKTKVGYRRLYQEGSASRAYRPQHWEEYKALLAGLAEGLGRKPEKAAQLMYASGNYVMGRAVRHFGPEHKREGLAVVEKVLGDPVFQEALRGLHFTDWTFKERIRNQIAAKRLCRLYWRWLWMQKGS